ncbi:ABC transporter ATP-binding protein [Lachnoclostridium phytofermentans]|uniref:ABC transporter related n=1 Tax=Lachnoclostridium phytofermentans (strain ATCC 700394 / DSM 18823 / ISDg) TaxID=357809 RepID=A9KIT4_LACP7|nr:ABC transporter ATP-binding protein [Lachnoclostridium phytofermentans]ABX43947.1 ABC transporter related [Lachnoclostridium phytofermentans ISDg]
MYAIEMEHISKDFGEKKVLKDLNIKVEQGEVFGLLGPSGAGKTTMIKIMTGQLKKTKGNSRLLGEESLKLSDKIYSQIGVVSDNSGVYERMNCYENLEFFAKLNQVPKERIHEVLLAVGLEKEKKTKAKKLSKGMSQRLNLARAVLHNPKILFLDEPTSGLDPATATMIHRLLLSLKDQGMTIFLTTHNMEEATKLCNHVALLNEGTIVEFGEPKELCRKYNKENKITITTKDRTEIILSNHPSDADKVADLLREGMVESIHSSEPNLETVFLALTGRGLL